MNATEIKTKNMAEAKDDFQPIEDSKIGLNAEEIQKLKLLLNINDYSNTKNTPQPLVGNGGFLIPQLPITEADLDAFTDTLMEGTQYSESYTKYKGKLKVTFKVRSRKDEEEVLAQINHDFKDGIIHSDVAYYARLNLYNLVKQIVSIDDISQMYDPTKTLRENAELGIFGNMPEPKLYILISLLSQFESKVVNMARKALAPDFFGPAIDT